MAGYEYEKIDPVTGERTYCPMHDPDGKVTGHYVFGVREWFDEHPEERKRLGWIKHIHPEWPTDGFNRQTQYIVTTEKQLDPYTITDEYHIMDKSEEMKLFEEMAGVLGLSLVYGYAERDGNGGIMYHA